MLPYLNYEGVIFMGSISDAKLRAMAKQPGQSTRYPVPQLFAEWLEGGLGRGQYFGKIDPLLPPVLISKMKAGIAPITFEYALRLERAQKPSKEPFKAIDIMTFSQDQELYRYVTGQEPAPAPVVKTVRPSLTTNDSAHAAGA
jgi:hypothetical protein